MHIDHREGQYLGQYRLLRLLGRGGFAEVYVGEHMYLKTFAAIKVLHHRLAGSEDLTCFLHEAQMVARLSHPSIVRVLDFGVDGDTPYLVMEYAPHGTLRDRHKRGERLPLATITPYIEQVAQALQYAHEENVIHRDVKPENMLIGPRQQIVLSDFGIALISQSSRYQSTQDVLGTVAYMAPEQIQGKPRPASDQYALGIVVYEWLCGARPFSGSFTELCTQHLFAPVPSLRENVPTIPPEVEHVVTTALAKDPKERFGSVQSFATALKEASKAPSFAPTILLSPPSPRQGFPPTESAASMPSTAPVLPVSTPILSTTTGAEQPPVLRAKAKPTRRKKALILLLLAFLVAGLLGSPFAITGISAHNDAVHRQALLTAYQATVHRQPDVVHDQPYQDVGTFQEPSGGPGASCTITPVGYQAASSMIVDGTPDGFADSEPECTENSLPDQRTTNLLVQVTLRIQKGKCGGLAVSSKSFEVEICADGSWFNCCDLSYSEKSDAIHRGLNAENILAEEVVDAGNNQVQLITFINGHYLDEQTASPNQEMSSLLFLNTMTSDTVVLFKDTKIWQLSHPVS